MEEVVDDVGGGGGTGGEGVDEVVEVVVEEGEVVEICAGSG